MKEFCHIIKKKHEWQVKQESRLANLVHVQDVTEPEGQGHVRRNPARRPLKHLLPLAIQFRLEGVKKSGRGGDQRPSERPHQITQLPADGWIGIV